MQRFTAKIVDVMKQEKLYASQGGPIILSQVKIWKVKQAWLIIEADLVLNLFDGRLKMSMEMSRQLMVLQLKHMSIGQHQWLPL